MRILLVLLCLCGSILPASGQQPAAKIELLETDKPFSNTLRFEQLGVDKGLSSQTGVYAIIQDRKGFIWIGTAAGLNRYDGYSFTHYRNIPFDSTSIASDHVFTGLYEDRSGAMWVGNTTGELNRLDPVTGDFTHWKHISEEPSSLSSGSVTSILERRSGELWIGTHGSLPRGTGGLNRMNRLNGTFTRYLNDPDDPVSLSNNSIRDLYEDDSGHLWISTANGLNRMDSESGRFSRYLYGAGDPNGVADDPGYRFTRFYADPREREVVWVGSKNGIVRLNTSSGDHIRYILDPTTTSPNLVSGMVPDPADEEVLWIATRKAGLYRLDTRTGRSTNYRHEPGHANSLSSDGLYCIYADRTGILWLCAEDDGVFRFDPSVAGVSHYGVLPVRDNGLSAGTVHAILEDREGALWVGVGSDTEGLNRIDRNTGKVARWSIPSVTSIVEDRSGDIWVGSKSLGLSRWDPESMKLTSYRNIPGDNASLSVDFVWSIYEDRGGSLWVGTHDGLHRMERQSGTFVRFMHDPDDPTTISSEAAVSFLEDQAGMLWVGTLRGGLNRMDRTTGTFTRYAYDPHRPGTLSSNAVWSLWERAREPGILWIATGGGGLNRLDTRTGTFTHFTDKDGLPNNSVWGILEDERGRLWLSTTGGLSRFDPDHGTFRNFGVGSGLPSLEFKELAFAKSGNGEFFFGGVNGLLAFYPDQMRENTHPPQVSLTGLRLFNRAAVDEIQRPEQPISMIEEIRLEHDQNSVAFDYVALHFRNPTKNQYAFKLEGFDRDWVRAGTQRSVTYTNLNPGTYTFRVKGSNSDGVWNEEGASIRLTILPPWWHTWPAYIVYGLLLLFSVVAVNRAQRKRLINRERQRAQITESRLKARALQAENRRQEEELEKAGEFEAMNSRLQKQATLLMEMDRVKDRFFANISHEFRTPMTLLLAPLRDALDRGGELRLNRRQVGLMHRNGERLLRLINQLLDLSRIGAGSMRLSAREADLVELLRDAVLAFSSRAERGQITLSFQSEEPQILLYYDPDNLEKVIFNLLSNAIKFTAAGGKIRVSTALEENEGVKHALIVVKDTGQGIASDKLPLIFDRFYQVDGSPTRKHEGTGIGLALTKDLIELHGGTISVESEIGFGSTFVVRLPLGKQHLRPEDLTLGPFQDLDMQMPDVEPYMIEEVAEEPSDIDAPADAPIVLVVGDNAEVRTQLRAHSGARYRIEEVADGLDGLETARRIHPDLVVADVMMPRLDGLALCRAIRAEATLSLIPIILLTTNAEEQSNLEGFTDGADDYLTKPFSGQELLARAENLIGVKLLRPERFEANEPHRPGSLFNQMAERSDASNVLIVEDNSDLRAYIGRHLADRYHVTEAADGADALEQAQTHPPDLIISDVMMPTMDGYALCRALKTNEKLNHIPVILLTAKSAEENKLEGLTTGADDYLSKPFSMQELLVRVENLIQVRRMLRRRFSDEVVIGPGEVIAMSQDARFVERVREIVEAHLGNADFGVDRLAEEVGLSSRQLHRRMRELVDMSPAGYIRFMRLERAAQLLRQQVGTISEVAYEVGFRDADYFSRLFKQTFGITPSAFSRTSPSP